MPQFSVDQNYFKKLSTSTYVHMSTIPVLLRLLVYINNRVHYKYHKSGRKRGGSHGSGK